MLFRKNQKDFKPYSKSKKVIRKRIETNFSQLCGQFQIHVNHAKSFTGLITRVLSKITAFTMTQYLNFFVFNRKMKLK